MKKLIIIFLVGLLSCDPPRIDPTTLNYVLLQANVSAYQRFNLGDTLRIRIDIPDSLEYTYYENREPKQKNIFVQSIQQMNGAVYVYKFDTINGGLTSYRDDSLNFSYQIANNFQKHPFYTEQRIIPKTKGIFFAEFRGNPAIQIKINNDFGAQLSVFYDVQVNKNMDIYCRYSSPRDPNTPLPDLSNCIQGMNETQRFYSFRVE
jgi:hypothetical protein